jgi:FtsH-binding integral membrane protein
LGQNVAGALLHMTDKDLDPSPSDAEQAAADGRLRSNWCRIGMYLALSLALSGIVGLAVVRIATVLRAFSYMAKNDLTIDEIKALDMLNYFKGPIEPVELNVVGWIAIFAPLGLLLWSDGLRHRSKDSGTLNVEVTQAIFWSASALMGVSLSLLFHYSDPTARLFFVIGAMVVAAWIHHQFVVSNLSRAGNALLVALIWALVDGLRYKSWFMVAVPLFVFGIAAFAVLLFHDVRRLGRDFAVPLRFDPAQEDAMCEALNFYLSLAGLVMSAMGLAG